MASEPRKRKTGAKKAQTNTNMNEHVVRGVREGALFLLVTLALYLFIALVTYQSADPGWTHSGGQDPVGNSGGVVGAWFADIVLYLLGYVAYLLPMLVAYAGWLLFRGRKPEAKADTATNVSRWSGFLILVLSSAGLARLHFAAVGYLPMDSGGGILGEVVGGGMMDMFSFLGATLFLLALFFSGFTLLTGMSWLSLMDRVGGWTLTLVAQVGDLINQGKETWAGHQARREREKKVESRREKKKDVPPPRVEPVIHNLEKGERVEKEKQQSLFSPKAVAESKPVEATKAAAQKAVGKAAAIIKPTAKKVERSTVPSSQRGPVLDGPADLPAISLLVDPPEQNLGFSEEALKALSEQLEYKLADFNVEVNVEAVHPGPVITRFEILPAPGTKVSKIANLAKDLARSLSVRAVRVVEVIPGKSTIGIEIPNEDREIVYLSELIASKEFEKNKAVLPFALGKDIGGNPVVVDMAKMPHLLVAGTTGSGKSVGVNSMIVSLLYKLTPDQCRLIMIDPKMLELSIYEGIPHLLAPVVTDMKEASNALRWCVGEMERRYKLMAAMGVRNIAGLNKKIEEGQKSGEPVMDPLFNAELAIEMQEELEKLPYIVVIVDEFADMMMVVGKKVEELIARLAQKARAAGIHLVLATQRPSVDVITGLIKANIPTRIAFQVSSRIDSRTILDQQGAEHLLGHGDMLYLPPGSGMPTRVHGAFVDDPEVHAVVDYLKSTCIGTNYIDDVLEGGSDDAIPGVDTGAGGGGGGGDEDDPLYDQAVAIVTETRKASISGVQRRLKIGYNRAARLVEAMEMAGIVGSLQANGSREVLAPPPPKD